MKTQIAPEQTVGELVAENPSRARVFENLRIDYCCGGKIPLAEACAKKGVDVAVVLEELAGIDGQEMGGTGDELNRTPLGVLIDDIVNVHHAYLREELPRLDMLTEKVARVHGDHHPATVEIRKIFLGFRAELEEHMAKEEQILFPWIRRIESGEAPGQFPMASIASPIHCMETEHANAGDALEKFRELTNDYTPPMDACNSWRVLYHALSILEKDMHTHVHKENNVLFPRAMTAETELKQRAGAR